MARAKPAGPMPSPRQARATLAILALLAACFGVEVWLSTGELGPWLKPSIRVVVALGGVVRHLVVDRGEWWRLVAGTLLHGDLVHLGMNALVILLAGWQLERRVGPARLLVLYVLGGTLGALGSTFINPVDTVSLGASGAGLALLAGLFMQSFGEPDRRRRLGLRIDSLRFLLPSLLPAAAHGDATDLAAHVGGTLAGLALGGLFLLDGGRPALGRLYRGLAAGLVLFVTAGVAFTAREVPGQLVQSGLRPAAQLQGALGTTCGLGSVHACVALAGALATGEGLPRDVEAARALVRPLCDRDGSPEACFYLGLTYQRARPPEYPAAAAAFEKACARNELSSCFNLAVVLPRLGPGPEVVARSRGLLERACAGIPRACSELALRLAEDEPREPARALQVAERACEGKEPLACFLAGWLIGSGQGTARDDDRARIFHEHACRLGEFKGCDAAGLLWLRGLGVAANPVKAVEFFTLACTSGEPEPCFHLARCLRDGVGTARDEEKARAYFEAGCREGYAPACQALGSGPPPR
jgi:TPR repeat protein/membrane associated rhomboid family serine protease